MPTLLLPCRPYLVLLGCAALLSVRALAEEPAHPLDPLSEAEMQAAVRILSQSGKLPQGARFPMLARREPPKSEVYAWNAQATSQRPRPAFRREAFAVVLDRPKNQTFEAVVDLRAGKTVSFKQVPGVQPLVLFEEYSLAQDLVRKDPRWQAAIRKRGIKDADMSAVALEPWAVGYTGKPGGAKHRLLRVMSFYLGTSSNRYARPIEGLLAIVDVGEKGVAEVTDTGAVPVPPEPGAYDAASVPQRQAPKPLRMTQPDGPSFTLKGHEVRWQKWRFRYSLDPREGLVLHTVGYEDHGQVRPILYRAALSEMVVPYGDPDPNWSWRSAFDVGEYGVGQLGCSLVPGADVPAYATLVDEVLPSDDGAPRKLPRAVGLYERDGGVLWRHWDYVSDVTHARRARELALSFMTAVGNYDYMLTWVFHQDGALTLEANLTGIMLAKGVDRDGKGGEYGHAVAPLVSAIHHQHFFLFRLDMDVDGAASNTVLEMNTTGLPMGPKNPLGNALSMSFTPLRMEMEAQRDMSLATARKWLVQNPSRKNALGMPAGYLLLPGDNTVPFADPRSPIRQRAGFINHHLWVTRFQQQELYAGGDYPNQRETPGGLPTYVADNQPIEGQDVVLWYSMGVTHIPRPEEWPIMTTHRAGFSLVPAGFFDKNPALDVPEDAKR